MSLLEFLAFLDVFLGSGTLLRVRILINEAVALILSILIALQLLALHTHLGKLVLALHNQCSKLLALVAVRIILQGVLGCNDASLIVVAALGAVAEIGSHAEIEAGTLVLLLYQQVLQGVESLGSLCLKTGIREEVEILLEGRDCRIGGTLVETWLRRILIEALAHEILRILSILSLRIRRIILLEILRCCFVVLQSILSHRQHIETLLALGRTLLHGHYILQQRNGTRVLALSKTLLGILVLIRWCCGLVHLVIFVRTTRHEQCCASCNYY